MSPEEAFTQARAELAHGDAGQARQLYLQAAEAGHVAACFDYARAQLYGIGGPPDLRAAMPWLARVAQAGHPAADDLLAQIALSAGDVAQATGHLRRAVAAAHPPALLAAALIFGRRADAQSQTQCLQWLEQAAGRGSAPAAALLAERLAAGEGCAPQPDAAGALWAQLRQAGVERLPSLRVPPPEPATAASAAASGLSSVNDLSLERLLAPPTLQPLSQTPVVSTLDRLLSADECRLLILSARPHLHPSRATDPHSGTAGSYDLRTSHDAGFDPLQETTALRLVQHRMAAAAGLPLVHAEQLIVLRYMPGQEYRPHRDYLPPTAIARDPGVGGDAGNRRRTVCAYLSHVVAGGGTAFPQAALTITPAPGRAVVFDNLQADGSPEPTSLHAGLPVARGEKWLATLWMRERRYRVF